MGLTKSESIIVNEQGERFADASAPYQDLGRATRGAGDGKHYLIGDHRHLRNCGMGMALSAPYSVGHLIRNGYMKCSPTVKALAEKLDVDPGRLAATGKDLDFSRGQASFDKAHGDPTGKPNTRLATLEVGLFYTVMMYLGNGVTMLGLKTTKDAQVLKASGETIPGLYAIGADATRSLNGHYASGGLTLGPATVFGYRAGLHM